MHGSINALKRLCHIRFLCRYNNRERIFVLSEVQKMMMVVVEWRYRKALGTWLFLNPRTFLRLLWKGSQARCTRGECKIHQVHKRSALESVYFDNALLLITPCVEPSKPAMCYFSKIAFACCSLQLDFVFFFSSLRFAVFPSLCYSFHA